MNEKLKWNDHIDYISSKVSRATGILAKLKHYLPKRILFTIYNSLCISHLSYAIVAWGFSPPSVIERLVILHKKGIRHVCNSKYNAHTDPLYKEMNTLRLVDLFKLNCNKIMFKRCHGTLHPYHWKQLCTKAELLDINTRQKYDVKMETHSENSKINSIKAKIGNVWNNLPFDIKSKNFNTITTFTKHIKQIYISKYNTHCKIRHCYICKNTILMVTELLRQFSFVVCQLF